MFLEPLPEGWSSGVAVEEFLKGVSGKVSPAMAEVVDDLLDPGDLFLDGEEVSVSVERIVGDVLLLALLAVVPLEGVVDNG